MKLVSKLALAVALAAPSFCPSLSWAQSTDVSATKPNTGAITFSGGADIVSAYYFRGYLQENSGVIVQPYFGGAATLIESDDFKLGFSIATWNSLHSVNGDHADVPADESGPDIWFENDIYITVPMSFGKFQLTPAFYIYQSPNGAFDSVQEGLLTVAYDDASMWSSANMEGFKLSPYLTVAYETNDGGGEERGYAETGIAPGYTFTAGSWTVPLTFPISLGMSYKDYYLKDDGDNDFLGYIQAGVTTQIPIPIPEKYGNWYVDGGVYYMNLFSDSLEAANHDSSNVVWGKVGFTFSY